MNELNDYSASAGDTLQSDLEITFSWKDSVRGLNPFSRVSLNGLSKRPTKATPREQKIVKEFNNSKLNCSQFASRKGMTVCALDMMIRKVG